MQNAWSLLFQSAQQQPHAPAPAPTATFQPPTQTWRQDNNRGARGRGRGRGGRGGAGTHGTPRKSRDDDDSDDSDAEPAQPKRTPRILQEIQEMLPPRVRELMAQPLDTPEQIAAYIAARKRAYPTAANLAKRQAEQQEAQARGELPQDAMRSFQRDRGRGRGGHRGGGRVSFDSSVPTDKVDDDAPVEESNAEHAARAAEFVDTAPARSTPLCSYFLNNRCKHGASCRFSHDDQARQAAQQRKQRDDVDPESSLGKRSRNGLNIPRPAPSLLRKLLATEVHREFSSIFQCFRHLVQHDFFQSPPASAEPAGTAQTSDQTLS